MCKGERSQRGHSAAPHFPDGKTEAQSGHGQDGAGDSLFTVTLVPFPENGVLPGPFL